MGMSFSQGKQQPVFNNLSNLTVNGKPYRCTDAYNGWVITTDDIKSSSGQTVSKILDDLKSSSEGTSTSISDLSKIAGDAKEIAEQAMQTAQMNMEDLLHHRDSIENVTTTANSAIEKAQLASDKAQQALNEMAVHDVACTMSNGVQFDVGGVKSVGNIVYLQFNAKASMSTPNGICEIFVLNDKIPSSSLWFDNQSATVDYSYMTAMGSRKVKRANISTIRILYDGRVIIGNSTLFNEIKADGGTDIRLESVKICFSYLVI